MEDGSVFFNGIIYFQDYICVIEFYKIMYSFFVSALKMIEVSSSGD